MKKRRMLYLALAIVFLLDGRLAPAASEAGQQPTIELRYGSLKISIDRGGTAYLDGAKIGEVPPYAFLNLPRVAAGPHTVKVEKAGFQTQEKQVEVLPEQTITLELRLVAEGSAPAPQPTPPGPQVAPTTPQAQGYRIGKDGLAYVWIPPGTFMMGCSPGDSECGDWEKPAHQVTITRGFWMARTEVTVGAYKRFASAAGRSMSLAPSRSPSQPVVFVSWDDAAACCRWAGGRLPTEAEWEYAARGGSTSVRYGDLDAIAWYGDTSGYGPHPVGQKAPNAFGLYDMLGSVWEWVADWFDQNYYGQSPSQDPAGPSSGQKRAVRGGSWVHKPKFLRSSDRYWLAPWFSDGFTGFRCVIEGEPPASSAQAAPTTQPPAPAQPQAPAQQQPPPQQQTLPKAAPPAPQPQGTRIGKDTQEYVWIPPGTFMMGCSPGDSECDGPEKPAHQVTISRGFWMGQTEVTVGAYKRFASAAGRSMPPAPRFNANWSAPSQPVVAVSWDDARAYCRWAGGRLPTEAEWEYAARGGTAAARYGELGAAAWYSTNSGHQPHPVGQKAPNAFGLYDMLGNLWEWVADWYDAEYYSRSVSQDPAGPSSGQTRVLRGGSWGYGQGAARASYRSRARDAYFADLSSGFRCVVDDRAAGPAAQAPLPLQSPAQPQAQQPPPQQQPAPVQQPAPQPQDTRIGKDGLQYVWMPPGTFEMGCVPGDANCEPDEKPRHRVTLTKGFWMGKTPVTVAAFMRYLSGRGILKAPPFDPRWQALSNPVVGVPRHLADMYCGEAAGGGWLPTEAQWEWAARGGIRGSIYPWGNQISRDHANYGPNRGTGVGTGGKDRFNFTSPVGSFLPNGYGLFDMAGNVWQITLDDYDAGYYSRSPAQDPKNPMSAGGDYVVRAGSFYNSPLELRISNRAAARNQNIPVNPPTFSWVPYVEGPGVGNVGFRCVIPGP